jgi:Uncharacterized protein conserved in bacteria
MCKSAMLSLARAAMLGACMLAALPAAAAQGWPTRPITLVVPFPPGGSTDAVGRLVAAELAKLLGQNVIVENKGGANGNIGSDQVAKAKPDGHTLLLSGVGSNAINYAIYQEMPYQDKDFRHVALIATGPNVLVASPNLPVKRFVEFLELVRKEPGKHTHASSGNGSSGHLSAEMLKQAAKLDMVHVPYKGGAAAITDTIAGRVDVLFLNQDNVLPHVRAGKLRALAVTSPQRNPAYPDVPTIAESGFPGFAAQSWFGVSAPAGTPDEVVRVLNEATNKALQDAALRQRLESVGFVVANGSPDDFARFVQDEIARWAKAAKASGARVD